MSNITEQIAIFDSEKKAVEIYKTMLDKKIDTSFYTDCRVEDKDNKEDLEKLQIDLLKMIKKSSFGYKNEIKQYCSSKKLLKDESIKNRLEVLSHIINNKRLDYLDSKTNLNNYEKKEYLRRLRELRNKLYSFNNSYVSSIGRKNYSFSNINNSKSL